MAFIDQSKVYEIEMKLTSDVSFLGKLYKAKKNEYQVISIEHSLVEDKIKDGWEEFSKPLKTKTLWIFRSK